MRQIAAMLEACSSGEALGADGQLRAERGHTQDVPIP